MRSSSQEVAATSPSSLPEGAYRLGPPRRYLQGACPLHHVATMRKGVLLRASDWEIQRGVWCRISPSEHFPPVLAVTLLPEHLANGVADGQVTKQGFTG